MLTRWTPASTSRGDRVPQTGDWIPRSCISQPRARRPDRRFASKAGAPISPDWYDDLTVSGTGRVEVGTDTYPVTVTELTGDERVRVWDEQAGRYRGFAAYADKTAGIRSTPLLAPQRA